MKKMIVFINIFILYIFFIYCHFVNCSGNNSDAVIEIPTVVYAPDTLVSIEYTFINEGLNQPAVVKQNPLTNEIVVSDFGNNCLYFFNEDGLFIRKVGRMGQGPGDFFGPRPFEFDKDGRIYVYEDFNRRLSILSKEGKFINSFRIINPNYSRFSTFWVTDKKEILVNLENSGYFITVFNEKGEVMRNIGPVPEDLKNPWLSDFAESFVFSDEENNFYAFARFLGIINVYNETGDLIRTTKINELLKGHYVNENYTDYKTYLRQYAKGNIAISPTNLMMGVFFNGSDFYIKMRPDYKKKDVIIIKIDKNFEIKKKVYIGNYNNSVSVMSDFSVTNDNMSILFPIKSGAQIIKFVPRELKYSTKYN